MGNKTSAKRLNLVNPGLEVDRTDLNVQEMSIHEPRLTVGNSTSTRRLNQVKPAIEDRADLNVQEMSIHEPRLTVFHMTTK